jgi:hypothetical protein
MVIYNVFSFSAIRSNKILSDATACLYMLAYTDYNTRQLDMAWEQITRTNMRYMWDAETPLTSGIHFFFQLQYLPFVVTSIFLDVKCPHVYYIEKGMW